MDKIEERRCKCVFRKILCLDWYSKSNEFLVRYRISLGTNLILFRKDNMSKIISEVIYQGFVSLSLPFTRRFYTVGKLVYRSTSHYYKKVIKNISHLTLSEGLVPSGYIS